MSNQSTIYYVEDSRLYVGVIDGKVFQFEKSADRSINPHAIVVRTMDVTFDAIFAAEEKLYLDALAYVELCGWLHAQMRNAKPKVFFKKLQQFFPGSAFFPELTVATSRYIAGLADTAHGEAAYYYGRIPGNHVEAFGELRRAFICRHTRPPR